MAWRGAVRIGMGVLAGVNLVWGAWARLWPRHFFDEFPGFGHRWTAAYPPYNEHLVTDLGSTFLTLGFLLAVAAALDRAVLRAVVLAGVLLFNVSHLDYHATHPGAMGALDAGASITSLVVGVLVPATLLGLEMLDWRARRRQRHDRPG